MNIGEAITGNGGDRRQVEERSLYLGEPRQDSQQERAGASSQVEHPAMRSEIVPLDEGAGRIPR